MELLAEMRTHAAGKLSDDQLKSAEELALSDTIARLEDTGSPVVTDGEQTKPGFHHISAGTAGPFHYAVKAVSYLSRGPETGIEKISVKRTRRHRASHKPTSGQCRHGLC